MSEPGRDDAPRPGPGGKVKWSDDGDFTIDGASYRSFSALRQRASDPGQFTLLKPRHEIERYQALIEAERPVNILELGIYAGGSVALLTQLAAPKRLAAIDWNPAPLRPELDEFIAARGLEDVVHTYYGVDQSDVVALDRVLAGFDGPLDLVIDDASHLDRESRVSFNRIFPYLRPGGVYVLEDWSWAHQMNTPGQPEYQDVPPMSLLVMETVLVGARRPAVVAEVVTDKQWALVRRGPAPLKPGVFDVSGLLDPVGRYMVDEASKARSRVSSAQDQPVGRGSH